HHTSILSLHIYVPYRTPTQHAYATHTLPVRLLGFTHPLLTHHTHDIYARPYRPLRHVLYRIPITSYTLPVVYLLLSYILYDNIDCCEEAFMPTRYLLSIYIISLYTLSLYILQLLE